MTKVIQVRDLTKRYRDTLALDNVSFEIEENTIYGVLGRNGAGKTTLMSILTAQNTGSEGHVRVFGEDPFENARVLSHLCFVRESQRYPDDAAPRHAFKAASLFFPHWDQELADQLVEDFQIPLKRRIKKLSRGQLSAVGVVIGLASRAEITFFDEPYLGLDAVARQIFYDRLLADYAEHPRTVLLSSHLIDEISDLIERVLVIDDGRIIMDQSSEEARGQATTLVGSADAVARVIGEREVIHRERLGRVESATFLGTLTPEESHAAAEAGLETAPVSLQELIVRRTQHAAAARRAGSQQPGSGDRQSSRDTSTQSKRTESKEGALK